MNFSITFSDKRFDDQTPSVAIITLLEMIRDGALDLREVVHLSVDAHRPRRMNPIGPT